MKPSTTTPGSELSRDDILRLKEKKLLDLIRRACANGTAKDVAMAIAQDWIPTIEVDADGQAHVVIDSQFTHSAALETNAAPQGRVVPQGAQEPDAPGVPAVAAPSETPAEAWLIEHADGSKEVVLSPLTDDHFIDDGEEAWPLYKKAQSARESLPADILAVCKARGWNLHWTHRGAYLHLEASELIEALRGKRGDPLHEAADVLLVLMSITENAGLPWDDVLATARATCEEKRTQPRYPGEEYEDQPTSTRGKL